MPVASVSTMAHRMRRTILAGAATALAVALTTACTPDPAPSPTPTGFASEEDAFAAAEATYRAYVDALNDVDLADPATFEPVYDKLSGNALSDSKRTLSRLHADGYTRTGETLVGQEQLASAELSSGRVTLSLCLDVTDVDVLDETGSSVVSPDRVDVQPLDVTFIKSSGELKIDDSIASEELACG